MDKFLEFGRRVKFCLRILSYYEECSKRSYRLHVEKRVKQAEERKVSLRKVPEQVILSEVRHMVEEMQNLNKTMEETDSAIEEYFEPLDKLAETNMKVQLEEEERTMKEMMKTMQAQALLEKKKSYKIAREKKSTDIDLDHKGQVSSKMVEIKV